MSSRLIIVIAVAISATTCRTPNRVARSNIEAAQSSAPISAADLPALIPNLAITETSRALAFAHLDTEKRAAAAETLAKYMSFLNLAPENPVFTKVLKRLISSDLQFIFCESFVDWACLEGNYIFPKDEFMVDTDPSLGLLNEINEPLRLELFFTKYFASPLDQVDLTKTLVNVLADKINKFGKSEILMALYGIDEIQGSMKPAYDAILSKFRAGVPVRGVFDTGDLQKTLTGGPFQFTYKKPANQGAWILDKFDTKGNFNLDFQYGDTVNLINELNAGISNDGQARARIEWPNRAIMHNKFMVLKDGANKAVWTGTANVSDTCMGSDRNSNVGVFIQNTAIAQQFETEFEEMFAYQDENHIESNGKLVGRGGAGGFKIGHFHTDKRPNTKRYFKFNDGNEVKIHFAPTDDAEHRVLLPLILSAKRGDVLRISMFGSGGFEYIRAFQFAMSRGVNIKIVIDSFTGSNPYSWTRNAELNLFAPNPYDATPSGKLAVRKSKWGGLNHHKSATLTRKVPGGSQVEVLIIGSQNWSETGNDANDENMISVRNLATSIPQGEDFNQYFDEILWPATDGGEVNSAAD